MNRPFHIGVCADAYFAVLERNRVRYRDPVVQLLLFGEVHTRVSELDSD